MTLIHTLFGALSVCESASSAFKKLTGKLSELYSEFGFLIRLLLNYETLR